MRGAVHHCSVDMGRDMIAGVIHPQAPPAPAAGMGRDGKHRDGYLVHTSLVKVNVHYRTGPTVPKRANKV